MSLAKRVLALLVPVSVAITGALAGWLLTTGAAILLVYGILAFQDRAVPRPSRLLLRAGLLLLACAQIGTVWISTMAGDAEDFLASRDDPGLQRAWSGQVASAACLVLACVCLAAAIGRMPRERLTRVGLITPMVGGLTLLTYLLVHVLASALLGARVEMVLTALVALNLCGLFAAWIVRRHGVAAITAVGASALAVSTYSDVRYVWETRPRLISDAFLEPGIRSMTVAPGPDIGPAIGVVVVLAGAILTVLTCARLSTTEPQESPAAA